MGRYNRNDWPTERENDGRGEKNMYRSRIMDEMDLARRTLRLIDVAEEEKEDIVIFTK